MPQATTPHPAGVRSNIKSVPKVVRVNAADGEAVLYRNLGNGRRLPFMWGTQVTMASGTLSGTVSSDVSFHGYDVSAALVFITPTDADSAGKEYYVSKDTTAGVNTVEIVVNSNTTGLTFDVLIMLGTSYDFLSTHTNQIWSTGH